MSDITKSVQDFASTHLVADSNSFAPVGNVFRDFKVWYLKQHGHNSPFYTKQVGRTLQSLGYFVLGGAIVGYKLLPQSGRQVLPQPLPTSVKQKEVVRLIILPTAKVTTKPEAKKYVFQKSCALDSDRHSTGNRLYKSSAKYKKPYTSPSFVPAVNDDYSSLLIKTAGKDLDECCEQAIASIHALRVKRKQEETENFYKDSRYKK